MCYLFCRKTGYDRGHLAASANHKLSQEVNCQTFFLSNICPQVGKNLISIYDPCSPLPSAERKVFYPQGRGDIKSVRIPLMNILCTSPAHPSLL
jgi:hypothetical protein